MIEPVNPNEVPPGGWRWTHPETGYTMHGNSWTGLLDLARAYLANNNFPIPRDLDQIILRWMDEEIQDKASAMGLPPVHFIQTEEPPTLAQKVRSFTYAMTHWAKSGAPVVTQDQYETRLGICQGCQYWRGSGAFGLGSCGKCGCTGLKLYMATTSCPMQKWTAIC